MSPGQTFLIHFVRRVLDIHVHTSLNFSHRIEKPYHRCQQILVGLVCDLFNLRDEHMNFHWFIGSLLFSVPLDT